MPIINYMCESNKEITDKNKCGTAKLGIGGRIFNVVTLISAVLLISVLALLLISHWIDPWKDRLSLSDNFHITVFARNLAFFNDLEYGPYRGSIIGLVDSQGNIQPPLNRQITFGYKFGVYYRYFSWIDSSDTLWTLMLNLWYLLALFAVLPIIWCIRFKS